MRPELTDAMLRVSEALKTAPYGESEIFVNESLARKYSESEPVKGVFTLLRLDLEIDTKEDAEGFLELAVTGDQLREILLMNMAADLEDVLINGDRESTDPLLISMDGMRKLNTQPVFCEVPVLHFHREFKPKKGTVEYTVYLLFYVEWEE